MTYNGQFTKLSVRLGNLTIESRAAGARGGTRATAVPRGHQSHDYLTISLTITVILTAVHHSDYSILRFALRS